MGGLEKEVKKEVKSPRRRSWGKQRTEEETEKTSLSLSPLIITRDVMLSLRLSSSDYLSESFSIFPPLNTIAFLFFLVNAFHVKVFFHSSLDDKLIPEVAGAAPLTQTH